MRRAELRIYRQLAQSGVAGRALYGVQIGLRSRELDFLVYLERAGRIGIEVKGGSYRLADGEWRLRTPDGWQRKPSPLVQLQEAVLLLSGCAWPPSGAWDFHTAGPRLSRHERGP